VDRLALDQGGQDPGVADGADGRVEGVAVEHGQGGGQVDPLGGQERLAVAVVGASRRVATSISSSGLAVDTVQSLPKASTAPARRRLAHGYCQPARSGSRKGRVSSRM
jgi:hypothetical protein